MGLKFNVVQKQQNNRLASSQRFTPKVAPPQQAAQHQSATPMQPSTQSSLRRLANNMAATINNNNTTTTPTITTAPRPPQSQQVNKQRHTSSGAHNHQHTNHHHSIGTTTLAYQQHQHQQQYPHHYNQQYFQHHSAHTNRLSSPGYTARQHLCQQRRHIRLREYKNLRQVIPSLRIQRTVSKVEVVSEAARYIDHLHKSLLERFVSEGIPDNLKGLLRTQNASHLNAHDIMDLVAKLANSSLQQHQQLVTTTTTPPQEQQPTTVRPTNPRLPRPVPYIGRPVEMSQSSNNSIANMNSVNDRIVNSSNIAKCSSAIDLGVDNGLVHKMIDDRSDCCSESDSVISSATTSSLSTSSLSSMVSGFNDDKLT